MPAIYSVELRERGDVVWVEADAEVLDALAPLGGERLSAGTMALRVDTLEPGYLSQNDRPWRAKLLAALGPLVATATARYLGELDATPREKRHLDHRELTDNAKRLAKVAADIDAAKDTWARWGLL